MTKLSKYVACICEGSAESAVIRLLLDSDKLVFSYDDLLDGDVIRCRGGSTFEERYLRKGFSEKITVVRILDSHREKFRLSKAYEGKIDVVNIVTAPEIEMLIILNEKKFDDYKKSGKKPSDYCKMQLSLKNVKSTDFVKRYFRDVDILVAAIREYRRIADVKRGEFALADLLK